MSLFVKPVRQAPHSNIDTLLYIEQRTEHGEQRKGAEQYRSAPKGH